MCYKQRITITKTRKVHRCDWCWSIIEKGASCYRDRGIADDQWFTSRLHIECVTSVDALDYCETYFRGQGDRKESLEYYKRTMNVKDTNARTA